MNKPLKIILAIALVVAPFALMAPVLYALRLNEHIIEPLRETAFPAYLAIRHGIVAAFVALSIFCWWRAARLFNKKAGFLWGASLISATGLAANLAEDILGRTHPDAVFPVQLGLYGVMLLGLIAYAVIDYLKKKKIKNKQIDEAPPMKTPICLCVMDGYGLAPPGKANAIAAARTPRLDALFAARPHTSIGASGLDVGLPPGQMGNSEVGHTNIGAGRVVMQKFTSISLAIQDGGFFGNEAFLAAIANCKANGSALHLLGLVSDGGVHSHNTHLYALLELAKRHGLEKVFIHCLMDGRDVPPTSGVDYLQELLLKTRELGVGTIATIAGRYYGMDRERKYDRVEKFYNAMVCGAGEKFSCGSDYLRASYYAGVTDEFVLPGVSELAEPVKDGDSVIFFNFRPDRAREITRAFVDPDFDGFDRERKLDLTFVCMTQYDATMPNVLEAYVASDDEPALDNPLGQVLSERGLKQLRIAEFTKYAHVTFFLNGGKETVYPGEDRVLIDSPNVPTYDLQPEMSAYLVTEKIEEFIGKDMYDVVIVNFANCDMVGHSGVFDAAVAAVEAVDACVGRVWDAVRSKGGVMLLTADHGNAERMFEDNGEPFTAHTTNPVPFLVAGYNCALREGGKLCDIAPTMLEIMKIEKPADMTGESLIV